MRFWRLSIVVLVVSFALGATLAIFYPAPVRATEQCRLNCPRYWCVESLQCPEDVALYVGYARGNDFDCSGPWDCGIDHWCTTQVMCAEIDPYGP